MKPFNNLIAACHSLLDRWEKNGQSSSRLFATVDYPASVPMAKIEEEERIAGRWGAAIMIIPSTSAHMKIKLINAASLYVYLGRTDPTTSPDSLKALKDEYANEPALLEILDLVARRWRSGKTWHQIKPGDHTAVSKIMTCALLIRNNEEDIDYRTFLTRNGYPSKYIEKNLGKLCNVLGALDGWPEVNEDQVLTRYNLSKIPQPLLVRGHLFVGKQPHFGGWSYVGYSPQEITSLKAYIVEQPKAVLLIENMVSFARYCETESATDTLVFYTGGFPSRAALKAIRQVLSHIDPSTPIYHWGDIDGAGVAIFEYISEQLAKAGHHLLPVGMTKEILHDKGTPDGWLRVKVNPSWHLADLAHEINKTGITVEQEAIEPSFIRQQVLHATT